MSGSAASPSGLRCRLCSKPFGFAVAFCPYCGTAQQAAAQPVAPVSPRPVAPAAKTPTAVSTFSSFNPALWLPGKTSVPTVPPAPKQALPAPKQRSAQESKPRAPVPLRRKRRRPRLITLIFVGLITAYLLRPGPAGTLVVYVTPSVPGRVTIDGEAAGLPGERLAAPAGMHRLGFEANGWTSAGRQVRVAAHEQRSVTIVLSPVPATLVIDLQTSGVTLRLDDQLIDASQAGLLVPAGRHRLTAMRPGFATLSADLVLGRGQRRVFPVALSPLVVREVTRVAGFGRWSEPVTVPPRTSFTMAAGSRFRLRAGQDVFFVQPGSAINMGDVRGQTLQVEAVDDQPVEVRFYLKPEE